MQIQMRFRRSSSGLYVNVSAVPAVEHLFRNLNPLEAPLDVGLHGRYWDGKLFAYPMDADHLQEALSNETGPSITLTSLGGPLLTENRCVNLSPLRLVGISEPGGVSFRYSGLISDGQLDDLANQMNQAIRKFYQMFLSERDITMRVMKEEHGKEA